MDNVSMVDMDLIPSHFRIPPWMRGRRAKLVVVLLLGLAAFYARILIIEEFTPSGCGGLTIFYCYRYGAAAGLIAAIISAIIVWPIRSTRVLAAILAVAVLLNLVAMAGLATADYLSVFEVLYLPFLITRYPSILFFW